MDKVPRPGGDTTGAGLESLTKATLRETREHNERLVLATIYDDGPVSRAEVARLRGLPRKTVSDMDALADALLGRIPFAGSLPVKLDAPRDATRGTGDWRSAR